MNNGLHHLHLRKRLYKNLEKYPHKDRFKYILDKVMFGVAIVMPGVLVPQVVQLYSSKDAAGLSFVTWFLLATINCLWATYGYLHKEKPILISSLSMGVLNIIIAVGIVLYQ